MPFASLSHVAAREATHLLILWELSRIRERDAVTVKGGVNLRLFFGSLRYSQDMDLDGEPSASDAIRLEAAALIEDVLERKGGA